MDINTLKSIAEWVNEATRSGNKEEIARARKSFSDAMEMAWERGMNPCYTINHGIIKVENITM